MAVKYQRRSDGTTGTLPEDNILSVLISSASVDTNVFIADQPYVVEKVSEVHSTAGTDAGAVSLDVKKCTGTQAPSAGTTVLSSTFNLKSTINTKVAKTVSSGLTTTKANRQLAAGDRLAFDFTGTLTALAGGVVQIHLRRLATAGADF